MFKGTPGPWSYRFSEHGGYDCMTDAFRVVVDVGLGRTIADLDCGSYGQGRCKALTEEVRAAAEANAKLIAAAPELVGALLALIADAKWQNAPYELLAKGRAALSRAGVKP